MTVHQTSHKIMVQVEEEEETMQIEKEVEVDSIMMEISSIFHHRPLTISILSLIISLLNIFPFRIFLNKTLLKVLSMKDHHTKYVGSLDIKLWIVITRWILLIEAKVLR